MQQTQNDIDTATELQLVFASQEEARYFPCAAPKTVGAGDEDEESSSREALIQAVLNGNTH